LLHDIGLLILEQAYPDTFQTVRESKTRNESLLDREENAWGTNHARVGQFLLEQWRLPEIICESVGRHHVTFTVGATDEELLPGQIVALANLIACFRVSDMEIPEIEQRAENKAIILSNLGLDTARLSEVQKELFTRTVEESRFLEIDIGSPDELLAESNRLLFAQYAAVEKLLADRREMQRQVARSRLQRSSFDVLKVATEAYARYLTKASNAIYAQTDEVLHALDDGAIADPKGLVAHSARTILDTIAAIRTLILEMENLTGMEGTVIDDQQYLASLEKKLNEKLRPVTETAAP
ncbi:MAG: HDOD domain-containing protein, partial [Candidatus Zixiibacteriota bacterium]